MKKIMVTLGSLALAGSLVFVPAISASAEEVPPIAEALETTENSKVQNDVYEMSDLENKVEEVSSVMEEVFAVEAVAEAVVAPVVPLAAKKALTPVTKTMKWLTPYIGEVEPLPSDPSIWDQTLYTTEVCGTGWIQVDEYKYTTPKEIRIVDALEAKGTLGRIDGVPEDSKVYISHVFVQQTACVEEPPAPEYFLTTSHTSECGTATVTLRNVSPWIYPVSFVIDGGSMQYGATVDNRGDASDDKTNSKTFTFDEDSGTHTIAYRVQAGTESDLYSNLPVGEWTEFTVESDCLPPVVEEPPVEEAPVVNTSVGEKTKVTSSLNVDKLAWTGENPNYTPLLAGSFLGIGTLLATIGAFVRRRANV